MSAFEPRIVAFFCNWCTYGAADLAGVSRLDYPPNFRVVRLPCTGRLNPKYII
jgi:coenzyme F420-reducing hydrogenase delta subunit